MILNGRQTFALVLFGALLVGCGSKTQDGADASSDGKIRVVVSVPPQAEIVRRIGGEHVHIEILAGEGQDPHSYSPTPSQMTALGNAEILFSVGMPYEEGLIEKITAADTGISIVDTGAGFEKIALQCDHPEHAHGEEGHEDEHAEEHHEPDPHIWLAPNLIKVQAEHIETALAAAAPEHATHFAANRTGLDAELDALHAALSKQMEPFVGEEFFVFHPAFGYFGHTYGIDQVAVEINGNAPTPKELAAFIVAAKEQQVKVLFTQPQFDSRAAETVAQALGARVVALDPLAPDVLANLRRIGNAIADGLAEEGADS